MSQSQNKSIISSDEDDYELPSLSERIKASYKPQHILKHIDSESEDEDIEFLKFSERIRNTPCSQVKFNPNGTSENKIDESRFSKFSEKTNTPPFNIKLDFSLTTDSENEESEFVNFSERIRNTPQSQFIKCRQEENSDSDETFSNLAQRLSKMYTPKFQNGGSCQETNESDRSETSSNLAERLCEIPTPMTENKEHYVRNESDSDDETFSNFAVRVREFRTPLSQKRGNYSKADESDSDESFLNFVEKLRTPMSVNKKSYHKENESDSDDSFLNTARRLRSFRTPMSQKRVGRKESVLLPQVLENRSHCHSTGSFPNEGTSNSQKICQSENEKEFTALFPSKTVNSRFLQNRSAYTQKLFEFFNRKIFSSKLPDDMSLIWDRSLISTAGLTCCSCKNDVYSCSIKLSSELLNSFDRLKTTLLHEMCHAAVWVINKQHKVRHGPLWQIWASRCKLILPFVECPVRCHTYEVSYRVWYQCTKCNWKKGRCKQVKKYHGAVCKRCKTPITMTYS